ncbi:MAG: hypothetical protein COX57_00900 [Alphaproteobacteria bacterium CG_4_10_14_0_2_um_filter_63_37]|nr:MAG: hypothetical protein AUJ55_11315 [Proteobacteria bacterium CG1_02_64_396]PJA25879.1 MAG: hypothetical protein COX57_00900 [Alphaproteobacteria bacterium CG_4_10_14_0_2_um_filter_63_37]
MLNCRQASVLVSQRLDRPLTLRERLDLHLHLLICVACRHFDRQMGLMHRVFGIGQPPAPPSQPLDPQVKARIAQHLDQALNAPESPEPAAKAGNPPPRPE